MPRGAGLHDLRGGIAVLAIITMSLFSLSLDLFRLAVNRAHETGALSKYWEDNKVRDRARKDRYNKAGNHVVRRGQQALRKLVAATLRDGREHPGDGRR